jgi:hypothetical protein
MFVFLFLFRLSPSRWWQFWDVFCYSLSPPSLGWQFCFMYIYDCLHWLVWCDAKLVDLVYSFFQNCKISLNTFSCRFQIAKPLNMIGDIFSFSKPWIVNFFSKNGCFIFGFENSKFRGQNFYKKGRV